MTLPGVRIARVMIDAHLLSLDITSNTTTLSDGDETNRLLGAKPSCSGPPPRSHSLKQEPLGDQLERPCRKQQLDRSKQRTLDRCGLQWTPQVMTLNELMRQIEETE